MNRWRCGFRRDGIASAISTGYGRANVAFVTSRSKTEIGCLSRWAAIVSTRRSPSSTSAPGQQGDQARPGRAARQFQDEPEVRGRTARFSRRCPAPRHPLEAMDGLARQSLEMVKLGPTAPSFRRRRSSRTSATGRRCRYRQGALLLVVKRVLEMDSTPAGRHDGGVVAHNPFIVEMAGRWSASRRVPEFPQLAARSAPPSTPWMKRIRSDRDDIPGETDG